MVIQIPRWFLAPIVLLLTTFAVAQNEARVIAVPDAPLAIVRYEVRYSEDGTYTTEGIRHSVSIQNSGGKDVVAFGIGFYAFDAFKRYMGSPLNGIAIESIEVSSEPTGNMVWFQRPRAAFTFKHYGIGVSYVRIVRFADGSIWEADMDYVLQELQTIEDGLLLDDLQENND